MPNTRPKRKTATAAEEMFTSVLKPVTVSTSSLESAAVSGAGAAAAAAASHPNEAMVGGLDQFDFDDFGQVDPYAAPSVGHSHPGAPHPATAPAASKPMKTPRDADGQGSATDGQAAANTIPEFLYQLTKLLTDDNRDAIEWNYGRIEVHNPHKLEANVLKKYFRHSKYASFQRQLNYFGWRKLNGKGKMAPCTYINDEVTPDIQCLLTIKRKVSIPKEKPGTTDRKVSSKSLKSPSKSGATSSAKRARSDSGGKASKNVTAFKIAKSGGVKHQLNGFLKTSSSKGSKQATLARAAVGKGIRHGYSAPSSSTNSVAGASAHASMPFLDPAQLGMGVESSLSQLTSNYLKAHDESDAAASAAHVQEDDIISAPASAPGSMLTRNDSLVDLAMLPTLPLPDPGDIDIDGGGPSNPSSFTFVDFPDTFDFPPPSSGGDS